MKDVVHRPVTDQLAVWYFPDSETTHVDVEVGMLDLTVKLTKEETEGLIRALTEAVANE